MSADPVTALRDGPVHSQQFCRPMLNAGLTEQFQQFLSLHAQPIGQQCARNGHHDAESFIFLNDRGELVQQVCPAPPWQHWQEGSP